MTVEQGLQRLRAATGKATPVSVDFSAMMYSNGRTNATWTAYIQDVGLFVAATLEGAVAAACGAAGKGADLADASRVLAQTDMEDR